MPNEQLEQQILEAVARRDRDEYGLGIAPRQLSRELHTPASTLRRSLQRLVERGALQRVGEGAAIRYVCPGGLAGTARTIPSDVGVVSWSLAALRALQQLRRPLGARKPVGYERSLVDSYEPNVSSWLPAEVATNLLEQGGMPGQRPAGTYARDVLEQLLIDLSWYSSRLEGNTMSMLDTERLFRSGATGDDPEALMLLNHKRAIEFMVAKVPAEGLHARVVRNIHALLMDGFLPNPRSLGAIRSTMVRITGTVYLPTQAPQLLEEMLRQILDKAAEVNNPVEAAFFLWVSLAYLQPFEDSNKRVSRLAANIPLMVFNCAPLSFLDVDQNDYARAMLAYYELRDLAPAADLFAWTYRRSCAKYALVLRQTPAGNPLRAKFGPQLIEAVQAIVHHRRPLVNALEALTLSPDERQQFEPLLRTELEGLHEFNAARFDLTTQAVDTWIAAGRPLQS
jgi:Fic family protein